MHVCVNMYMTYHLMNIAFSLLVVLQMVNYRMVQDHLMPGKVCSNVDCHCSVSCYHCTGPSSGMLQLIQEIRAKVGREEDAEDYEALERIVQSNNFSNLMEVSCSIHKATHDDDDVIADVYINEATH